MAGFNKGGMGGAGMQSLMKQAQKMQEEMQETENLLDDCIILNTYSTYFIENTGFEDIQIVCGTVCYDNYLELSLNCKKDILENQVRFIAPLAIDELVKRNTSAEKKLKNTISQGGFYPYNFIFTKLEKNLEKFAGGLIYKNYL